MNYDPIFDKWHEECGVFGVFDRTVDVARYVYWGLFALQHRGQESAGIAITDGNEVALKKGMGLLTEAIKELPTLKSHMGTGHVRYSTTGSNNPRNIQPLVIHYQGGQTHNGNLTNALGIRRQLEADGSIFQTTMDSEVIVNLIARSKADTQEERIADAARQIEGAFSLVITTNDSLVGLRDPQGFRPLCLGKTEHGYVLSSESCAFDAIKAEFIRDIDPGEMVIINDRGVRSTIYAEPQKIDKKLCVFEYIYFARSDSKIDGQSVYETRLNMGRELYNETKYDADIVMSIPDSGTTAALGYARASGIPFAEGLIKNRYKILKEAGAKEIYMCVSSPAIEYSCHYGIDTSVRKELIAATHTIEEIRDYIKADKLHYLSKEGLCRAVSGVPEADLCFACFNGDYRVDVPTEQEEGVKYVLE